MYVGIIKTKQNLTITYAGKSNSEASRDNTESLLDELPEEHAGRRRAGSRSHGKKVRTPSQRYVPY